MSTFGKSPKKTGAAWVGDFENGDRVGRGQGGGPSEFGISAPGKPRSPAKSRNLAPPPFHTFPDQAPHPELPKLFTKNTITTHNSPSKRPRPDGVGAAGGAGDTNGVDIGGVGSRKSQNTKPGKSTSQSRNLTSSNPFTSSLASLDTKKDVRTLWDLVATAVEVCSVAIDEAATATESDGNATLKEGTVGFGKTGTSNAVYGSGVSPQKKGGQSHVSHATRKKRLTRAAQKLRHAKLELANVSSSFDELREFATATQAALWRAQTAEHGVIERLQTTAGYAEETTARLARTSQAHKQLTMTTKQLGEALDVANAHIGDLTRRLKYAEQEAVEVRNARVLAQRAQLVIDEAQKQTTATNRHKAAVAKLTADNMVFLMRLKESEVECRAAREEADSMRMELEESRGVWFDKARKDVERVVQNAMRRAEDSDAALEAEIADGEKRAEAWGDEIARLRAVAAQNESLAATTVRATEALDDATAVAKQNEVTLRDSRRREFDALNGQKTATHAMACAREEMGVLKQRMAGLENALQDQKRVSASLVEKAQTSVAALATQQQINAGVMRLKNDAEWRMLEMRAAFEVAGLPVPSSAVAEVGRGVPISTPRLAGRPNPADTNGGVSHSALSPLPTADDFGLNTPMPISPSALAKATEAAFAKADLLMTAGRQDTFVSGTPVPETHTFGQHVMPVVQSVFSENYANEFAFDERPALASPPSKNLLEGRNSLERRNSSPRKSPVRSPKPCLVVKHVPTNPSSATQSPVRYVSTKLPEEHERVGRVRTAMRTTAAPTLPKSSEVIRSSGYGASDWVSPTRTSRSPAPPRSPEGRNRSPSQTKPAWGNSPSKDSTFLEEKKRSDARAEARVAGAEWSRAQAREYSVARKSVQEDDEEFHEYEYETVPSRKTETASARSPERSNIRSAMASVASGARRRVDMDSEPDTVFEDGKDDDDEHEIADEAVFLRAAFEKTALTGGFYEGSPGKKRHRGGENGGDAFLFDFGVVAAEPATTRLLSTKEVTSYGATK